MQVAGEAAATGAGLAAHQRRYVAEPGIERAQQPGQLEVSEPGGKAGGERIARGALRERERRRQARAPELAQPAAQRGGIRRIDEQVGIQRVEQALRGRKIRALGQHQPGRAPQPRRLPVRELELRLEGRCEPEQHHLGRLGAGETGICRPAEHRVGRGDRQACERRAGARFAMHDPEPRHGVQSAPEALPPRGPWPTARTRPDTAKGNPCAKPHFPEGSGQLRWEPADQGPENAASGAGLPSPSAHHAARLSAPF